MKNLKTRFIIAAILVVTILTTLSFAACSPDQDRSVVTSTTLELNSAFSGKRTIRAQFPSYFSENEMSENLATVIRKYCPDPLTSSVDNSSGSPAYTFTLEFSSYPDYISKLTSILGTRPVVVFSNPSTPLTSGWRIEEYFTSDMLLKWISFYAQAEKFDGFVFDVKEENTSVSFGGENVTSLPTISVNRLKGHPITSIQISTVNRAPVFDRTIDFKIPQTTFDALGDDLSQYFRSITDESAETQWQLEDGSYIYTAAFTNLTEKQLEGYTNRLLSSVYGDVSYLDKTSSSTPLAYQNSFTETLDFSSFIGQSGEDVPIRYTYALSNDTELSDPLIFSDFQWMTASDILETTTETGSDVTFKGGAPSLTLRINDGKQYTPVSIDIAITPLDNDILKKSYTFRYDIAQSGNEAAEYTASYFKKLGIASDNTVDSGNALSTISFSGTAAEINSSLTDIFGDTNLVIEDSSTPAMTLRTQKTITDNIDLSSLLIGKNIDVPINYTLIPRDGEIAHSMTVERSSSESANGIEITNIDPDKDGVFKTTISAGGATIKTVVSVANWSDIIVFIIISAVAVIAAIGVIILLRQKKLPQPELGGNEHKVLPDKKTSSNKKLTSKNDHRQENKKKD